MLMSAGIGFRERLLFGGSSRGLISWLQFTLELGLAAAVAFVLWSLYNYARYHRADKQKGLPVTTVFRGEPLRSHVYLGTFRPRAVFVLPVWGAGPHPYALLFLRTRVDAALWRSNPRAGPGFRPKDLRLTPGRMVSRSRERNLAYNVQPIPVEEPMVHKKANLSLTTGEPPFTTDGRPRHNRGALKQAGGKGDIPR